MAGAKNYEVEQLNINAFSVEVTSYQIGEKWYCHVNNIDPGATIVRVEGDSRTFVKAKALEKAEARLS